jgi:hypothetical protein
MAQQKVNHLAPPKNAAIRSGDFKATPLFPLSDRERYDNQQYRSAEGARPYIKFYIETKIYPQADKISSECADILFINSGTQNAYINDVLLTPSQTLRIDGQYMEIDTTVYYLKFSNPNNPGNQVTVLRKLYV